MVYRNNTGRLSFGFISVCLETRWLGKNSGFYTPEQPCTTESFQDARKRSLQPRDGNVILTILGRKKRNIVNSRPRYLKRMGFPSSSDNDIATPKPAAQWASLGRLRSLAWSLSVLRGAPLKLIWLIWDRRDATGTPGIEPT